MNEDVQVLCRLTITGPWERMNAVWSTARRAGWSFDSVVPRPAGWQEWTEAELENWYRLNWGVGHDIETPEVWESSDGKRQQMWFSTVGAPPVRLIEWWVGFEKGRPARERLSFTLNYAYVEDNTPRGCRWGYATSTDQGRVFQSKEDRSPDTLRRWIEQFQDYPSVLTDVSLPWRNVLAVPAGGGARSPLNKLPYEIAPARRDRVRLLTQQVIDKATRMWSTWNPVSVPRFVMTGTPRRSDTESLARLIMTDGWARYMRDLRSVGIDVTSVPFTLLKELYPWYGATPKSAPQPLEPEGDAKPGERKITWEE